MRIARYAKSLSSLSVVLLLTAVTKAENHETSINVNLDIPKVLDLRVDNTNVNMTLDKPSDPINFTVNSNVQCEMYVKGTEQWWNLDRPDGGIFGYGAAGPKLFIEGSAIGQSHGDDGFGNKYETSYRLITEKTQISRTPQVLFTKSQSQTIFRGPDGTTNEQTVQVVGGGFCPAGQGQLKLTAEPVSELVNRDGSSSSLSTIPGGHYQTKITLYVVPADEFRPM